MTEFKIENKPVLFGLDRGELSRYPFAKMKVGQSFFMDGGEMQAITRVRSAASQYAKRHNMKFSVVKEGTGYRCGRVV
jgi:hypothetical protein